MRLIDADAFKEQVAAMTLKGMPVDKANAMLKLIDMQPTAYNVDQMEKDTWNSGHAVGYVKGYDDGYALGIAQPNADLLELCKENNTDNVELSFSFGDKVLNVNIAFSVEQN